GDQVAPHRHSHTLTVALSEGDTRESISEQYGGAEILAWSSTGQAGAEPFAVLGLGGLSAQALASFGDVDACDPEDGQALSCREENNASFLSGGERLATAGRSRIWSEGRSRIWDDGPAGFSSEGRSRIWDDGPGPGLGGQGKERLWDESSEEAEYLLFPANTERWAHINLDSAHSETLAAQYGEGVTVAVIDTGVDLDHPFFGERKAFTDPATWRDFVDGDDLPHEEGTFEDSAAYGHGTNVAGIVLQVAPLASIMPLRVLDENGHGYVSDLVEAVQHAVNEGADIINLSLGSPVTNQAVESVLGWAAQQGVYIVMSAGNTGELPAPFVAGEVTFPATLAGDQSFAGHEYLLTVTSSDLEDEKSGFAAHGSSVGIAAPGEYVDGPAPDNHSARWRGTSMSAPMAAGALALALAQNAEQHLDPGSYLISELTNSGSDHYADGKNADYLVDEQLGRTRLDVATFLHSVLPAESD
ncbi:MAG TPA: S8 family serine peptidase, partial [Deinococcales bacterium]|nr:S8 family serine peptidase [Deinococcales bacterium]